MEMIRGLAGGAAGGDRNQISSEPCGRRLPPSLEASGGPGKPRGPWGCCACLEAPSQAVQPGSRAGRQGGLRREPQGRKRTPGKRKAWDPGSGASCYWLLYLLFRGEVLSVCSSCPLSLPEVLRSPPGIMQTVPPQSNPIHPPWEASLCPSNCLSSLGQRKAKSKPFSKEFHSKPSIKPLLGQAHARF